MGSPFRCVGLGPFQGLKRSSYCLVNLFAGIPRMSGSKAQNSARQRLLGQWKRLSGSGPLV
jgi:hypothetical protein